MRIAITGTPGTGKTTLCSSANDWSVHSVSQLALAAGLAGEVEADGAAPIDVEALAQTELPDGLIDGHLSHLLPVDAIVVLRCHPDVLRSRLEDREYTEEKVEENVEAELLALITAESLETGLPVLELETSEGLDIERMLDWFAGDFKPPRPTAVIDWIAVMHGGE